MNKLLPSLEELVPITDKNSTFYNCGFNTPFSTLSFEKQLQIINDIVRQSILVNGTPNPYTDFETLEGNCQTAAIVSIEYMKELGVGKNHRFVLCRKRKYDPEDITTKHAAVLVDDENDNTYFFDATPYIASNYGKVEKLSDFYAEYEELNSEASELLFLLKDLNFKHENRLLSQSNIPLYTDVVFQSMKYPILSGYCSKGLNILALYLDTKFDKDKYTIQSLKLNPYNKANPKFKEVSAIKKHLMQKQIALWQEELHELLKSGRDLKRQLELKLL